MLWDIPYWSRWSQSQGQQEPQSQLDCCCISPHSTAGFGACEFASVDAAWESLPGQLQRKRSSQTGKIKNRNKNETKTTPAPHELPEALKRCSFMVENDLSYMKINSDKVRKHYLVKWKSLTCVCCSMWLLMTSQRAVPPSSKLTEYCGSSVIPFILLIVVF